MALINICGFESGDAIEAVATAGTFTIQGTTTRGAHSAFALRTNPTTTGTGSYRLGIHGANGAIVGANITTSYTRLPFRYGTKPAANSEEIFAVVTGGNALKFALRINSAGNLEAYDQTGTNLLATGSTALAANTWYRIEAKVGNGAAAAWEVKIDGSVEISGTGDLVASNSGSIYFGKRVNRNGQSVDFYFDDCAWDDAAYPGDGQCTVMTPDAAGSIGLQTFTIGAGAGSHFQLVDEIPHNSDTDYLVSTQTIGQAEIENLESAASAGISGTVNAVKSFTVIKRDGGTNGSLKHQLRSTFTDSFNSAGGTTSAYQSNGKLHTTDPATSAAWTVSALDSLQVGSEEASNTQKSRLTLACVFVDYTPSAGAQTVSPSGIASTAALGSATVKLKLLPTGIASTAALGSPTVKLKLLPSGISSSAALGSLTVKLKILPSGIASTAALGSPSVRLSVAPSSIASTTSVGSPSLLLRVLPTGIASTTQIGAPALYLRVLVAGIASTAQLGSPSLLLRVLPTGIASTAALGSPLLRLGGELVAGDLLVLPVRQGASAVLPRHQGASAVLVAHQGASAVLPRHQGGITNQPAFQGSVTND